MIVSQNILTACIYLFLILIDWLSRIFFLLSLPTEYILFPEAVQSSGNEGGFLCAVDEMERS